MTETTTTERASAARPVTFRLPKPGVGDPHFGFSRSFYYQLEKRGLLKMVRIVAPGREKGVTLIPFRQVEAFVRSRMEPDSNAEFESARRDTPRVRTETSRAVRTKAEPNE